MFRFEFGTIFLMIKTAGIHICVFFELNVMLISYARNIHEMVH